MRGTDIEVLVVHDPEAMRSARGRAPRTAGDVKSERERSQLVPTLSRRSALATRREGRTEFLELGPRAHRWDRDSLSRGAPYSRRTRAAGRLWLESSDIPRRRARATRESAIPNCLF